MNTAVLSRLGRTRNQRLEAHAGPAEYRSAKVVVAEQAPASTPAPRRSAHALAAVFRTALVVGSVACAAVTLFVASGQAQVVEPELATLLRGMATIKGLLALAAAAVVWWRLGQPISARVAVAYVVCVWVLFGSTALIWQLAIIIAAAVLFHTAGLVALLVAFREGGQIYRSERQAPNPSIERTFQRPLRALWPAAHVKR